MSERRSGEFTRRSTASPANGPKTRDGREQKSKSVAGKPADCDYIWCARLNTPYQYRSQQPSRSSRCGSRPRESSSVHRALECTGTRKLQLRRPPRRGASGVWRLRNMSKYGLLETQIADQKYLIAALGEMGYRVEVHPQGAALVGYEGHERQEKANIIIRRQQLDSASNDIGFTRASHGRYAAPVSEHHPRIRLQPKMAEPGPPALQREANHRYGKGERLRFQGPGSGQDRRGRADPTPVCCSI